MDKYYTNPELAKKCIDTAFEVLVSEFKCEITDIIEPSAGNGSFSLQIPNCKAYDIEPEHNSIVKEDYLELATDYKKGRLVIGNPPYGSRLNLAQRFFKKSVEIADYIAFILPISQLNNSFFMYEFDLVYSEDLGKQRYTDRDLHCCFNIYVRPENGLNSRPKSKLKDVTVIRQDSKKYDEINEFDVRMCYWGDGSAGKILYNEEERYSGEYKIIVNNPKFKEKVVEVLSNIDWHKELKCIAMLRIKQYHINQILQKYIPEIE